MMKKMIANLVLVAGIVLSVSQAIPVESPKFDGGNPFPDPPCGTIKICPK